MSANAPIAPVRPPPEYIKPGKFRIAFYRFGPETGRPLVICHGLSADARQFVADAEFFAARGFNVLVPELRGHGRSTGPGEPRREDFTIEAMARDIEALLEAVNFGRPDWVGNSLGGIIGLKLIERDRDSLRSFASFGTAYALHAPRHAIGLVPFFRRLLGRDALEAMTAMSVVRDPDGQKLVREILADTDPAIVVPAMENLRDYDFTGAIADYDRPILLARCRHDRAINIAIRRTLKAVRHKPNFHLVEMRHSGHCANLDEPDRLRSALLEHLARAEQSVFRRSGDRFAGSKTR